MTKKQLLTSKSAGFNLFLSELALSTFEPVIGFNSKCRSDSVTKRLSVLFFPLTFLTHKFYLSVLISYLILHPIIVLVSTINEPPTLKCPDQYAFEVKPGIYVKCENYDEYMFKNNIKLELRSYNDGK